MQINEIIIEFVEILVLSDHDIQNFLRILIDEMCQFVNIDKYNVLRHKDKIDKKSNDENCDKILKFDDKKVARHDDNENKN